MSAGAFGNLFGRPDLSVADVHRVMQEVYRKLPYEQAESIGELFRRIANGRLPLVFNCSAGKDRTGVAAALLLCALGIPRATIEEDYLLTNAFLPRLIPLLQGEPGYGHVVRDRPDVAMPLLRAEPEYLAAMFEAVANREGSVATYLQAVAGISPAELRAVRAELLE
jgi:protein-tyrosine phosphatase